MAGGNDNTEPTTNPAVSPAEAPPPKEPYHTIGEFQSIEDFTKSAMKEVVEATRALSAYPDGSNRDLYCTYPSFGKIIDKQADWILKIISKVVKMNHVRGNIDRRPDDEQFDLLLECNDSIMERLNCNLEEMAGTKKASQPLVVSKPVENAISLETSNAGSWNLNKSAAIKANFAATRHIERPQFKFQIPIDNSIDKPFVPKLKEKPNSLKPLAILPEYDESGKIASFVHPYEFELMKFEVPETQLEKKVIQQPKDLEQCDWLFVDSIEKLKQCLEELRNYNEIAVDVEHHSYRSFQGITCLVQLSTRDKDYIIDALTLRDEVHILNEVFTNPKIVKILHGADMDVEWLQRDLALYIVNMFDTHQAAKALNMLRLSLSYLLKHYCDLEVDKTFQLADWRIRPLPEELVKYARQDTHYLLYIYDCITNDLLKSNNGQKNLLRSIYQRSTEICKKRYEKPSIDDEAHLDLFRKSRRIFDNRQLTAMKDIYHWRDSVARKEDESYGYVLPNHMLLQISESLPREMQGILACCNPIPPLVRQHLHTIHQIILRAREQPLVKPILEKEPVHRATHTKINDYHNRLYCPHDISNIEEFRDDLPTLLVFKESSEDNALESEKENQKALDIFLKDSSVNIFSVILAYERNFDSRQKAKKEKRKQITPYLRYLAFLPEAEKEKLAEAARLKKEMAARQLCPAASMDIKGETIPETKPAKEDIYQMPIKEMLKRKRDRVDRKPDITQVVASENQEMKRFKYETPVDDKLKFVELPPQPKKTKKETPKLMFSINSSSSLLPSPARNKNTSKSETNKEENAKDDVIISNDPKNPSEVIDVSSDSDTPIEVPIETNPSPSPADNKKNNMKLKKKKNKNKFKAKQKYQHPQSSNRPIQFNQTNANHHTQSSNSTNPGNFDYKNVDFKRFQGGAQRAKGPEHKGQFHAKSNSNKSQNKKFNKLFTFSNVKNNKK